MAFVAEHAGSADRAVRLRSASVALLAAKGSGWLHAYVPRPPHGDAAVAGLRNQLDEHGFAEAWTWGESIDHAGAIAYAMA
jgi:hypothetical protein